MTMKKFEFKKTYEEIDLAGKVFKIDFSDGAIIEYNRKLEHYYIESQKLTKPNVNELTQAEQIELFNKSRDLAKRTTDAILGAGAFEYLYEQSGNSLMNMIDVLAFLGDIIVERLDKIKQKEVQKFQGLKVKNVHANVSPRK